MSNSTPKPLPEIPASPVLRRLTDDSNSLITTFIRRIVDEEGLDSSWTSVLKNALVDFDDYIQSAQILTGLKATRKAQNHASAEHRRKARERPKESKAAKSKECDKGKDMGKDRDGDKGMASLEASVLSAKIDVKLREIHALTSTVATPTSPDSPKHLFLTIVPPSDTGQDPDEDFDIISASYASTFAADTFSFPFYNDENGRQGQGGVVICGLDNWLR
jgi:1-phosphatidylinositol-3-phosphate 5-kinase